jgi:hypothetical protein
MIKKPGLPLLLAAMLAGLSQTAWCETIAQTKTLPATQQHAWLGVTLAPVPRALARQLHKIIPNNQGVMVEAVSPASPAERAGIRPYDILLDFSGQKIYSPQQLASLVAAAHPGEEASLKLVREGVITKLNLTLGNAPTIPLPQPRYGYNRHRGMPPMPGFRGRHFAWPDLDIPGARDQESSHVMEQFESILIKKLKDNRYHAEIEYLDNNGEKKRFVIEGEYEQIREQIANNKDLPQSRKNSLLNALKLNPDEVLPDGYSGFPFFPGAMPQIPPVPNFDNFFNRPESWF